MSLSSPHTRFGNFMLFHVGLLMFTPGWNAFVFIPPSLVFFAALFVLLLRCFNASTIRGFTPFPPLYSHPNFLPSIVIIFFVIFLIVITLSFFRCRRDRILSVGLKESPSRCRNKTFRPELTLAYSLVIIKAPYATLLLVCKRLYLSVSSSFQSSTGLSVGQLVRPPVHSAKPS